MQRKVGCDTNRVICVLDKYVYAVENPFQKKVSLMDEAISPMIFEKLNIKRKHDSSIYQACE